MGYSLKSVFKGASIFSVGQILTKASAFFLLPLYTRFLTPTDFGIIGYLEVLFLILTTVFMFGFYGAQTRYYYEYKNTPHKVGEFLFSINSFLFISLFLICLSLTIYGEKLYVLFSAKNIPFYPYIVIIIWTALFQIMNQLVISFYLATKKYIKCTVLQLFQFFLNAGFIIFFVVVLKQGALGKVKGALVGNALFFVIFYTIYVRHFKFHISYRYIMYALSFGVPIVFHSIAGIIHLSIDRIILEKFISLQELGIYTLGYQIGMLLSVLVSAINNAWTPNYYELMKDKAQDHAYQVRKVFYLIFVITGAICLMGSLWSNEFILVFTTKKFYASAKIIPIILFSYMVEGLYYFGVIPIFFYNKTKYLPFLTCSAAIINIGLNLLFIPKFGIMGAAYATCFSHIYISVVAYLIGRRLFDPGYDIFKVVFILILLFLGSVLVVSNNTFAKKQLLKLIMMLIFSTTSYFFFRDYINSIYSDLSRILRQTSR